ncbi:uncharacterized protein N7483_009415 [Penicillium malachiteum]|uniref:uncharacterized protein n=1 Tax=Penicillium malachiteum TaxID=1324776 RepID=UPI002547D8A2|nr:uncharacterized protein N7483_009415 [Penicillium malachiteum]KAJ5721481.1 hypothetical protein N7483_009415 [Penicillium malachiteum]
MPFLPPGRQDPTHARLYPRHHNPNGFLPIAPRPSGSKKDAPNSSQVSRSGSTSASASDSYTPGSRARDERLPSSASLRRDSSLTAEYWSGSEGSGNELDQARSNVMLGEASDSKQSLARSAPDTEMMDTTVTENIFDPLYSLLPSSSVSTAQFTQTAPMISPLEGANPFDFPLDPALGMDAGTLSYLEDMDVDVTEGLTEDLFHVEDWSRYMWSPETGFEHLDMGYPPVTR